MWPFTKKQAEADVRRPRRFRQYQAAKINRLTAGWTTEAKHPDQIVKDNLQILRSRSRELYANNDYMARFVSLAKSNIVGPYGIRLQATARDDSGALDTSDNDALERAFAEWGRPGNCDVSGQLSLVDIQRLFISSLLIDGEFLAVEHNSGPHGYRLALIDPEHLDIQHNRGDLRNGNTIRFSIEYTNDGRPVRYYIRDDAEMSDSYSYNGRRYRTVDADRIIHCFVADRVGQKRGIPAAATAMMRLNMLGGYEEAAVTAARIGAAKMGFFTSPGGDGYLGDGEEDGALLTDVEPGIFEQLPEGMDFKAFDPDYPHQQFPSFVKTCLRGIASGLGVSYNSLSNDLEGVNYSSIRTGVLEDREAWKAMQEWMAERFMRRIYLHWLPQALALGVIRGPRGAPLPMSQVAKFSSHTWRPRRWDWVDPLKDTNANIAAINNGLKSRQQIIRETGGDPEQVWSELEAEAERLSEILNHQMEVSADAGSAE